MNLLIWGNLLSLLATFTDLYSVSRKTARSILIAQTVTQGLLGLSSVMFGAYSAVVQNVVSIIRNLTALSNKSGKIVEYGLVAVGVILGIAFNNLGWVGWLPIMSNLIYSVSVFRFKNDEHSLKIAFTFCVSLFIIFNFAILNFVGAASNITVVCTAALSLIKGRRYSKGKADRT